MNEGSVSAAVVERARAGSPGALGELYDRYGGMLHAVAYRLMRNRADAEDIVQDVFVGLPEALKSYEHRGHLHNWLKTLTVRASLMALRSQRRRRETPLDDAPVLASRSDGRSPIDRMALESAIAELPETYREVFILKVVEGYSHNDVGRLLGISTAASRVNLHRARQMLENRLRSSI